MASGPGNPAGGRRGSWRGDAAGSGSAPKPNQPAQQQIGGQTPLAKGSVPPPARGVARRKSADQSPVWQRIFVPLAALAVVVIVSGLMLYRWIIPTIPEVLVEAIAITNYTSPLIPPNDFATGDLKAIGQSDLFKRSAEGGSTLTSDDAGTSQTRQRLDDFFDKRLQNVSAGKNTVVVYLSAHGIASDKEAFLLTSETDVSATRTGWYPLRGVLEKLANSAVTNKLLILDATRIQSNLDLGVLGNDFLHYVKQEFASIEQQMKKNDPEGKQRLWVICGSDDGQPVWTTYDAQRSWFGTAVAYALSGGVEANKADAQGRQDSKIDTQELVDFVTSRLAKESTDRQRVVQTPVVLKVGEPFPVTAMNPDLTFDAFSSQLSSANAVGGGADAAQETAEASKDASTAAAADPAAGEKSTTAAANTPEALEKRIDALWAIRGDIASRQPENALARVDLWNWLQQQLMAAEQHWLAGQLQKTADLLRALETAGADLQKPLDWPRIDRAWTRAVATDNAFQSDERVKELQKQFDGLDAAVKQPGDLKAIADSPLVEAALLRLAARRRVEKEKWADESIAKLVRDAIQTRTVAESAAKLPSVLLVEELRRRLEDADRARRAAEAELLAPAYFRPSVVTARLQEATDGYQSALADAQRIATELNTIRLMLGDVPYIIRLLGARNVESESRANEFKLLGDFLIGARKLAAAGGAGEDTLSILTSLARQAGDLRAAARGYAQAATQKNSSVFRVRAALEIPWIDAADRKQLRDILIADASRAPPDQRFVQQRANPYPLADYLAWFSDRSAAAAARIDDRMLWDPGDARALTNADLQSKGDLRARRAQAGMALLELFQQLADPPKATATNDAQREFSYRLASAFVVKRERIPQQAWQKSPIRDLYHRQFANHIRWQMRRLRLDAAVAPPDMTEEVYAAAIKLFETALRQPALGAADVDSNAAAHTLTLDGDRDVALDESSTGETRVIKLRAGTRKLTEKEPVRLWVDFDASQLAVEMRDGTPDAQPGRIWQNVVLNAKNEAEVPMTIRWRKPGPQPAEIHMRAELPDVSSGELYASWDWLGALRVSRREAMPRLRIKLGEQTLPVAARTEIYVLPNSSLGIRLSLDKNVADTKNWSVVWEGGETKRALPLFVEKDAKIVADKPSAKPETGFLLEGGRVKITLFQGETKIDSREIEFKVARPVDYLEIRPNDVVYSGRERRLSVTIRRRIPELIANVTGQAAISLSVSGIPDAILRSEGAKLTGVLPPGSTEAVDLSAVIPKARIAQEMIAHIAVNNYQRAFRFKFGPGTATEPATEYQIRLGDPPAGAKLLAEPGRQEMQITLHADGPNIADNPLELQVRMGLVDSEEAVEGFNPRLDGRFRDGRVLAIRLAPDAGGAAVTTEVSDIKVTVPGVEGFGGRKIVVAEVHSPQGEKSDKQTFDLHFLPEQPAKPELDIDIPTIPIGSAAPTPIPIAGEAAQMRLIDRLRIGIDLDRDGKLDATEPSASYVPTNDDRKRGRWEIPLATRNFELKPDTTVSVRLIAELDVYGKKEPLQFTYPPFPRRLVAAEQMDAEKPSKTGTVVLHVFRGGIRVKDLASITLTPNVKFKPVVDGNDVVIPDVPVGDYTLQIDDTTGNYSATKEITVRVGKNPPIQVPLSPK